MPKVFVTAVPRRGFWRAGRYWPHEGREETVDDETLKRLQAEPRLTVKVLERALDDHTVAELRQMAADRGVDLTGQDQGGDRSPPHHPDRCQAGHCRGKRAGVR
jgi:hypothetical protein